MHTASPFRAAAASASTILLLAAGIAGAAPASADEIIASDTPAVTAPPLRRDVPTAVASRPATITVTNHRGQSVTLFAKGERIRRVLAPGTSPAVFRGLTPGRTYTVAVGGSPIAAVVALSAPRPANGLKVRTTSTPGSVTLTWSHSVSASTGGRSIVYDVVASAPGATTVRTSVVGSTSATLTGLDSNARYTFTVTPRNSAGHGRSTSATMSRTLAQVSGSSVAPTQPVATPAAVKPVEPAPAPPASAPAPAPAPAPGPSTRIIYVCPDGFTETAGVCRKAIPYTYHSEQQTSPYTYHSEQQLNTITVPATFNGSVWTWTCPSGYADGGGQWGVGVCKGTVTVQVKDVPPLGWFDTGSAYAHDIEVKDAMPQGYLDDGTQWVKTVAKVAKEVPV